MGNLVSSADFAWVIAPLAVGFFGIIVLLFGTGHLFRGRPVRGGVHYVAGLPLALGGVAASLIGVNVQSYGRLTYEAPVATVSVRLVDPRQSLFDVTVQRVDAKVPPQHCRLQGDEWELSANVQKWQPWANILGLNSTYTLGQISNRYFTAQRGNGHLITACDLNGPMPQVDSIVPQSWLFWFFSHAYVEQRDFGSAAFMPLGDGAEYSVIMTQSGLNAEPVNAEARAAASRLDTR